MSGLDGGKDDMVDLFSARTGPAGENDVTGDLLIDPARMCLTAFSAHVLGMDAFDEEIRQLL